MDTGYPGPWKNVLSYHTCETTMVWSLCEGEAHCSEEQGMSLVNLPDPRHLDSTQEGMQYLQ